MPTTFFGQLFSPRMLVAFLMGFACGVPLLLTGSVLQAWMTEEGVDLTVIGLYSLVGLPYTLKFLWAPVFDRFTLPLFGRRRPHRNDRNLTLTFHATSTDPPTFRRGDAAPTPHLPADAPSP